MMPRTYLKKSNTYILKLFCSITTLLILLTLIILSGCKTPEALLINNALKQTHEAVTPVIQTASWAESWWMDRHNSILGRNKTKETDLIFLDDDENIPEELMPDKLHPSPKCYYLWGDAIIDDISNFLDK